MLATLDIRKAGDERGVEIRSSLLLGLRILSLGAFFNLVFGWVFAFVFTWGLPVFGVVGSARSEDALFCVFVTLCFYDLSIPFSPSFFLTHSFLPSTYLTPPPSQHPPNER
ncbi:hypothetical protein F4604DRAFT_1750872 [Suillus subluteus]|nr:hypothetical protein F4604DRAFT_1750872 [Suillus subluteus]